MTGPQTACQQISDYLTHYAQVTPESEAIIFNQQRISYGVLEQQVRQCAKALLAAGIQKGDRVAVLSTPRPEYWVLFLASTQIGAIWLGLNPKYQPKECRYVLDDARPRLVFMMAEFEGRCYHDSAQQIQRHCPYVEQIIALTEPMAETVPMADFLACGKTVTDQTITQRQADINRLDPALLVYTSGSTGNPKGALLSHYGLCFGAAAQCRQTNLDPLRAMCSFPINHVACVADTCCVVLASGGTLVLQERFDPVVVLQTVEAEQITSLGGVPTMLMMLLEHPNVANTDFSSVQLIVWGGAALPVPLIERLQQLAPRLMNVYGMTETATNVTFSSPDADLVELSETIGRPDPTMPCRIINSEGKECAVGEHGELQFKGEYLLLEYLNNPEATRDVYTEDGWLHTGDLGYWRDNGTISLVGRVSDMFKSGGYNVYPREIENCLESHPAIDMAAVVSVPDSRYQEVGAAFVKVNEQQSITEQALRDYCKAHLANYKIPKSFTLVAALPTLSVGKVDKVGLKKQAIAQHKELV